MLRSVKYGLHAAVLAALVAGTLSWINVDKAVTLVVDGHVTRVHTTAATVDGVLAAAGYHHDAHDRLAPNADASVHDGSRIVLKRGRLLRLDVNGHKRDVWTTATTVAAAMGTLGYSASEITSDSSSARLPLSPTDIAVRTPRFVTIVHDGKTEHVTTTDATVGQLLDDLDVPVGSHDTLSMPRAAMLTQDDRIVVQRVSHGTRTVRRAIPFHTRTSHDADMFTGQTRVVQPGRDGIAAITYALVYIDGKQVGKTKIKTVVVRVPRAKLVKVGSKDRPAVTTEQPNRSMTPKAATNTASSGSASDPATDAPSSGGSNSDTPSSGGSPKAIAKRLVADHGWSSSQYGCLVTLWDHESGWNVHASNGGSGAYGIPQALPGSKMSSAGSNWRTSATTQITWGIGYIAGRYDTPCGAWSFWQAHGWY